MTEFWDRSTDVIIIGSGAAGLSAAIEARQAGAAVMVFEKMPVTGGNTCISDGGLSAPDNFMQKQLGGCTLTECILFGRIAGRNAAATA
jgi:succinate dehydrogenase/fumarate reductase flavoprotein subunit